MSSLLEQPERFMAIDTEYEQSSEDETLTPQLLHKLFHHAHINCQQRKNGGLAIWRGISSSHIADASKQEWQMEQMFKRNLAHHSCTKRTESPFFALEILASTKQNDTVNMEYVRSTLQSREQQMLAKDTEYNSIVATLRSMTLFLCMCTSENMYKRVVPSCTTPEAEADATPLTADAARKVAVRFLKWWQSKAKQQATNYSKLGKAGKTKLSPKKASNNGALIAVSHGESLVKGTWTQMAWNDGLMQWLDAVLPKNDSTLRSLKTGRLFPGHGTHQNIMGELGYLVPFHREDNWFNSANHLNVGWKLWLTILNIELYEKIFTSEVGMSLSLCVCT